MFNHEMDVSALDGDLNHSSAKTGDAPPSPVLAAGSFAVAVIEAVCVFLHGLSKLGILIGLTSLMAAEIAGPSHAVRVRAPLMALAVLGALANLFILWNAHHLRQASAAAWRKRKLPTSQRRRIVLLVALSLLSLILVAGEVWIHPLRGF